MPYVVSCGQQSHHYSKLSPIQEVRVMRLELSRLPVLSLFNEKQGILLRENIIPSHNLGPLPLSRNCHAVIQPSVGQAGAHIWCPHVHFHSLFFMLCLALSVCRIYAYFTRQEKLSRSHNAHKIIRHY